MFEYRVVPVPTRCLSAREAGRDADPVALTVEALLNDMGAQGWEFVRIDTVTLETRRLLRRREVTRDILVFRRTPALTAIRDLPEEAVDDAPSIERIRARRVSRADLSEVSGRRRITPRPALEPRAAAG